MDNGLQTTDYDPFGDPAPGGRTHGRATRRARNVAVAMFWSAALMLIAGRIYQHDTLAASQPHPLEIASR